VPERSVCAVVTTYGSRGALCARVVERLLAEGVAHVVVVDNGSEPEAAAGLAELAAGAGGRVEVIRHERNLGSAPGVAAGLRRFLALEGPADAWVLDDDNEPAVGALTALLRARADLGGERVAVLAHRPARPYQARLVAGMSARDVFPSRSSFLYFNVLDLRARLRRSAAAAAGARRTEPVRIPYGAYGGLLLSRALVQAIGLPDEALVLYEDDTEYTSRLARVGAELWLVPASEVADIDESWLVAEPGGTGASRLLSASQDLKAYYSTRNRVLFERRAWMGSRLLYAVNRAVWLGVLGASALRTRRFGRLRLVLRAVRDGERGRTGEAPPFATPG
jgi:GT2 family glycosyltransferase